MRRPREGGGHSVKLEYSLFHTASRTWTTRLQWAPRSYQRWEAGLAAIPEAKLKRLAKILKTNPDALLGRHPPIKTSLYDDSVSDELSYYGEVSVHFCGGGAPLLLSISEEAFTNLYRDLQRDIAFVTVESLANQTVLIRIKAISDLYFSSEAYDDYGPEHGNYANHIDLQIPDARDWEIIEALAADSADRQGFDPVDVERIKRMIMITDEQYEKLVADGAIKAEELDRERTNNQRETDLILNMSYMMAYQLSTGQRRSVYVDGSENLFNAFGELIDLQRGPNNRRHDPPGSRGEPPYYIYKQERFGLSRDSYASI